MNKNSSPSTEVTHQATSIDEQVVSREIASKERLDSLMNSESPYEEAEEAEVTPENDAKISFDIKPDDKAFLEWGDVTPNEEVESEDDEEETPEPVAKKEEPKKEESKAETDWVTESLKEFMQDGEEPKEALSRITTKVKELEQELQEENETIERLATVFQKNPDIHEMVKLLDKGYTAEEAIVASLDLDTLIDMKKDPNLREKLIEQKVRRELEQKQTKQKIQSNYQSSTANLEAFYTETALDDSAKTSFTQKIDSLIQPITEGLLTKELLSVIHKGLKYDQDVNKAKESGKTAGLNTQVKKEINRKKGDGLPNAGSKVIDSGSPRDSGFINKSLITNGTWG